MIEALESMEAGDREISAWRCFEELDHAEIAPLLGIGESTASKRHGRAIPRLKPILDRVTAMAEYPWN